MTKPHCSKSPDVSAIHGSVPIVSGFLNFKKCSFGGGKSKKIKIQARSGR